MKYDEQLVKDNEYMIIEKIYHTLKKLKDVEKLNDNTPNGIIIDADTILVDLIEKSDYQFTGFAQDIFNIWKASGDKESVEQMFYEFTGMEFETYLDECLKHITRNQNTEERSE